MPSATAMSCTSCEAKTCSGETSHVFKILPRNGRIAWYSRSRACLAEPPAESPSTRNNSVKLRSCELQSASLPGSAGPLTSFLRTTFFAARKRRWAELIAISANNSAVWTFWLSHKLKASFTTPPINTALWREERRSLVCPANCGSCILREST